MAKKSAKVEEIKGLMRGLPDDELEDLGIEPLKDMSKTPLTFFHSVIILYKYLFSEEHYRGSIPVRTVISVKEEAFQ
jgi:hypothetical protein